MAELVAAGTTDYIAIPLKGIDGRDAIMLLFEPTASKHLCASRITGPNMMRQIFSTSARIASSACA